MHGSANERSVPTFELSGGKRQAAEQVKELSSARRRLMPRSPFIATLQEQGQLSAREADILASANVTDARRLQNLLWSFPSLRRQDIDIPRLSFLASSEIPELTAAMAARGIDLERPPRLAMGAIHVPGAPWEPGSSVEPPPQGFAALDLPPPVETGVTPIDKRPAGGWQVRDQGERGTCVSFAVTALREHLAREAGESEHDLSEQFLYWATKTRTGDPDPTGEGTWIQFARDALESEGICSEDLWPYDAAVKPNNETHETLSDPSQAATSDASGRRHSATFYSRGPVNGGNAAAVLRELQSCQPVAVSLPVFADPLATNRHNWNSPLGQLYGEVLDPPPGATVVGGHAVCVTGFQPDDAERSGGYFVIRNSWGSNWGSNLAAAGYHGPEPGYGQISASYVDRYLWELCRL